MIRHKIFAAAGLLVGIVALAGNAFAFPQLTGNFNVTFYLEPSLATGATQCVVFTSTGGVLGESSSGTWTSPTFSGWQGQWVQRGDDFKWFGISNGSLATSEAGNLSFGGLATGHFIHFSTASTANASSGGYFKMQRVGSCPGAAVTTQGLEPDPAK